MKRGWHLAGVFAWLAASTMAQAAETDPGGAGLRINGFGTLGLTHADTPEPWRFRTDFVQPVRDAAWRLSTESRLGVQANLLLDPQWELVGQLLLKDRSHWATPERAINWAFAAWHPSRDFTVRAGRLAVDLFQSSEYRSVGFAYPWARPNVEFYGWIPMDSFEGVDATWRFDSGSTRWRLRAFAGGLRLPIGEPVPQSDVDAEVVFEARGLVGATLMVEQGPWALRLGHAHLRGVVNSIPQYAQLREALGGLAQLPVPAVAEQALALQQAMRYDDFRSRYASMGLAYDDGAWVVQAEAARVDSDLPTARRRAFTLGIGHRFGPITGFVTLGLVRSPAPAALLQVPWFDTLLPVLGPEGAGQAQALGEAASGVINASRIAQRSRGIGLRWDLDNRRALKLQWDRFDVQAAGGTIWGRATLDAMRARVFTATLDFLF